MLPSCQSSRSVFLFAKPFTVRLHVLWAFGFAFSAFGFAASGISADRSWAAEDGRRIRCNKNSSAAPVNFDAHRTGKRGCRSISGSWAHGICYTLTRLMLVAAHEVGPHKD